MHNKPYPVYLLNNGTKQTKIKNKTLVMFKIVQITVLFENTVNSAIYSKTAIF